MKKQTAFVLGGGGAKGALQVGALQALQEANYRPDILVGTSIGAANATFIAVRGFDAKAIEELHLAWMEAIPLGLLPPNYLWLTVRSLFNRPVRTTRNRMSDFFETHGLSPNIQYKDIHNMRLYVISTDLYTGTTIVHGQNPEESILEGLLASISLPPWMSPIERGEKILIDGGVTSNLPIEAAILSGANEIIALDLTDPRDLPQDNHGFGSFLFRLVHAVNQRQIELERKLAEARRVRLHYVRLCGRRCVPIWDFHHTESLIEDGYLLMKEEIKNWGIRRASWWNFFGSKKESDKLILD